MLTGFWKLTWVEAKVYVREPLGVIGPLAVPVLILVLLGGTGGAGAGSASIEQPPFNVVVLAALLIAVSAVMSLVAIIAIYREGGILKRLRATPLSPITILGAHVVIKLCFTLIGLALLALVGSRTLPAAFELDLPGFTAALLLSTLSILSLGFVIASVVPSARFAQPISALLLYPMVMVSGLFFPVEVFPPGLRLLVLALPTTHAVALMESVWQGAGWPGENAAALVLIGVLCTALAAKVFRWE